MCDTSRTGSMALTVRPDASVRSVPAEARTLTLPIRRYWCCTVTSAGKIR